MNWGEFFGNWEERIVYVPSDLGTTIRIVAVIITAYLAVTFIFWLAGKRSVEKLKILVDPDNPEASVTIRTSDSKKLFNARFQSIKQNSGENVVIRANGKSASAVLYVNRQQAKDSLHVAEPIAKALNLSNDESHQIMIEMPLFRIDRQTWNHPRDDVKLQWRLSIFFLVVGILIPKLLDTFVW